MADPSGDTGPKPRTDPGTDPGTDPADGYKADLLRYLRSARESLRWKLDGLSEYDIRRPLVPTGTNLLGIVKHVASVEAGYFGAVFGRPFPEEPFAWFAEDATPNDDMWATAQESRAAVLGLYARVAEHSDATIAALPLDARGRVPWWRGEGAVTLHRILVHMTTETYRHAGHADLCRELVDGAAGLNPDRSNLPEEDAAWWSAYRDRVQAVADEFR